MQIRCEIQYAAGRYIEVFILYYCRKFESISRVIFLMYTDGIFFLGGVIISEGNDVYIQIKITDREGILSCSKHV